ncbi:adenylylsulfate kinase [Helicobacter cinaedi PAGU611]|uniref:class I SAM-dependent methyltransferase n=1 Tax=Helicobacter cinaedi TaxID=213 RepID=UPI00025D33EB|nr:class I SAM-dependent methyltransferase [Helicobacter cinaedi]BAM12296.1 adenylylsulfate kinase [Helicobacter cinaedi PAGU611]
MDKTYWREFYSRHKIGVEPSLFAKLVYKNYLLESINCDTNKYAESNAPSLLELGCGNGRDSLYFANNGIDTTAIDQVQEEVEFLNGYAKTLQDSKQSPQTKNIPRFLCGDFAQLDSFSFQRQFDCIYSRFTLHSVSKAQQDKTLADCLKYCKDGGILSVEVRGEKNSLCGKGKAVENETNAFIYDNHYRRFLNFTQTLQEIESLRFSSNNATQGVFNKKTDNTSNTQADTRIITTGGGGIMLSLTALKFSMQKKIMALHHLMVKMTTLSALSQERSIASLKAILTLHRKLTSKLSLESSHSFTNNSLFTLSTKPSRIAL